MGRVSEFNKAKSYDKQKKIFQSMFPGMRIHALRNMDEKTRNKILKDFKLERWFEAQVEAGNLGVKHGDTFGKGQEAHDIAKITTTKTQDELRKLYGEEAQKDLSSMLERLRTPYKHPINAKMEEIFGHLQNPILEGLMAQEQPRGSLFPSAIEQEYRQGPPMGHGQKEEPSALGNLFSALGNHAVDQYVKPWMNKQTPESLEALYNQGRDQYAQPAYDYVAGSRPVQGLQNAYGLGQQVYGQLGREGLNNLYGLGQETYGNAQQGYNAPNIWDAPEGYAGTAGFMAGQAANDASKMGRAAGNVPKGIMDILSALGNKFRR